MHSILFSLVKKDIAMILFPLGNFGCKADSKFVSIPVVELIFVLFYIKHC